MSKSKCLVARISPAHLTDYLERRLTSNQIARLYSVKPACVNRTLPKRAPRDKVNPREKAALRTARNEYRDRLAQGIINGTHTAEEASETAHCSIRTMYRHLSRVKRAQVISLTAALSMPVSLSTELLITPDQLLRAPEQAAHA